MPKGPQISEAQKVAVAFLLAQESPPSQGEVAVRLGISAAAVSRARTEMLERKVLVESGLDFRREVIQPDVLERALGLAQPVSPLHEALRLMYAKAGIHVATPAVHVVSEARASGAGKSNFSQQAARYVRDALLKGESKLLGVAWGPSVAGVLDGLHSLGPPGHPTESRGRKLRVIPLAGDPIGKPLSFSSTNLAERLATYLMPESTERHLLSLSSVPAFIPRRGFTPDERAALRKFIRLSEDYLEIFGGDGHRKPLVDRLDVVLTGVSRRDEPLGYSAKDLLHITGIELRELQDVAIGDIGGVFLRRRRPSGSVAILDEIEQDHWTGVRFEQLRSCADRARSRDHGPAGVIVVASGSQKAECVMAAIDEQLVNQLIIDSTLEAAMLPLARRWEIAPRK